MSHSALLLHGYGNKGTDAFFPWLTMILENRSLHVTAPDLPIVSNDGYETSMQTIDELVSDQLAMVVGHSSGCFLALKLAEQHAIDHLILVAPQISANYRSNDYRSTIYASFSPSEAAEQYISFHSHPIDFAAVASHCDKVDIVRGGEDPYIPRDFVAVIQGALGPTCRYTEIPRERHMGVDDNCVQLPMLESLL